MNIKAESEARLSTLDLVFSVMDSPARPLDFALVFHLKQAPSIEALRLGAASARNRYPTTGSYIKGKQWIRFAEPSDGTTLLEASTDATTTSRTEEFLDRPFDPREQAPVQQLVIRDTTDGAVKLITRFHHAAADGLSAAMWLRHQLRVASNKESPLADASPFDPLPLRTHSSPVKRSRFAHLGPSHRLWSPRSQLGERSHTRRWHTIKVAAAGLRRACRRAGGFTYNDLLATCALEVFVRWNRMNGAGQGRRVGLWLPVNIRQQFFSGFGNGTGRIRIYARYGEVASLLEKCREVRRQISWSGEHGEWAVPQTHPLTRLPLWLMVPPLRRYLSRPWVDVATGVFSHAERWDGSDDETFQNVEKIESIGQLHRRHCVAINGATHQSQTWLTFTYDPGLLSSDCVHRIIEMYQEQIRLAERELV